MDDNQDFNLFNINTKKFIYNQHPINYARDQITDSLKNPYRLSVYFNEALISNEKHIHPVSTNKARAQYEALNIGDSFHQDKPIGLAIVLGCGLAHQVNALLSQCDVRNLVIHDRIVDGLYASLYTVDWEDIAQEILNKKGSCLFLLVKRMMR